jgi:hypothetical protein
MTRLVGGLVIALLMVAVPATALAELTGAAQDKSGKPKTVDAIGAVTAVTPSSLTVKGKNAEWTFTIDKETNVTAKGATTKSLELRAEGKSTKLTDFVKVGDQVTVNYYDGATKLAATIRVTTPAK